MPQGRKKIDGVPVINVTENARAARMKEEN
jgi:hypothetical protein